MIFDLNLEGHSTVQIIHKDVSVVSHVFCNYHSLLTLGMGFFFRILKSCTSVVNGGVCFFLFTALSTTLFLSTLTQKVYLICLSCNLCEDQTCFGMMFCLFAVELSDSLNRYLQYKVKSIKITDALINMGYSEVPQQSCFLSIEEVSDS